MLQAARRAFPRGFHGHCQARAYRSPPDRDLFEFTSGRFLYNEQARLAERYVPFNVGALKFAITRSLGKKDTEPARFRKWMEGSFCRVLTVDFDDGEQVVVKIPYKSAIPRKLTTESEVATLDLLRCHDFPVPRVFCWGPDCDNEVGAAYIVMSQAKGTPLSKIWTSLTREEILPLMQSFVELEAKLFELPFRAYGSIYYRDGIIPDAFQTDIFAPDSETGDTQASKFCIGPLVERSFWRGKLFDMSMDRGPWESPAPFLYCVGHKERELARKYGNTFVNQAPYTNLIKGSVTPNDFIEVLEKYLAVSPHILPSSPESQDCKPLLRHPRKPLTTNASQIKSLHQLIASLLDLQPEHIFLDEDGKISTLTGWQYSSILPSLLVCGNPLIFSNPDPLPPKDIEEPGLPDNYSRLAKGEQEQAYTLWRDRMLYYYYALFTSLINKPHGKMMLTPFQPVISDLVSSANRPWKGDSITLKCALIRFVQLWPQIMSERTKHKHDNDKEMPKCPLSLELDAVKDLFDLEERWNDAEALKEAWRTQIGIDEDGWIDGDKYDEAVEVNEALKKQWFDTRSDESGKSGSAEEQEQWPFEDYEEPE